MMIINSSLDIFGWLDKRYSAKIKWHRWFAWFPVRVRKDQCVWWEYVERKASPYDDMNGTHWNFEYRQIGDTDEH